MEQTKRTLHSNLVQFLALQIASSALSPLSRTHTCTQKHKHSHTLTHTHTHSHTLTRTFAGLFLFTHEIISLKGFEFKNISPRKSSLGSMITCHWRTGKNIPRVDFTNFNAHRSQKHKKDWQFALLGSACMKAANKMLVKLIPDT